MGIEDEDVEAFFDGLDGGLAVHRWVCSVLDGEGPYEVRTTASQVAFRRRRGFAYLWRPGRWLAHLDAPLVLSVGTRAPIESDRWKEVVHPTPTVSMHHLELRDLDGLGELDDEVAGWLRRAYGDAA